MLCCAVLCCVLQEIGGTVFGYDPSTDIIMLKEPGTHGGVVNMRLYKAAQLQVGWGGGGGGGRGRAR